MAASSDPSDILVRDVQYRFRRLTRDDAATCLPRILALVAAEAGRGGSRLNIEEPGFYARLFAEGEVFVACRGDDVVGFAALGLGELVGRARAPTIESLGASGADVGVCLQLLIAAGHRGRGLGRRLHALRILTAIRRGLRHLVARVHVDDPSIARILDDTGFVEIDRRELDDVGGVRSIRARRLARPRLVAPRLPLCRLPTAIEPLPRLSAAVGGPAIFVKRDDTIGVATGGNKSRMLELLVPEALDRGARTLVTRGHRFSNHCRQTAAVAARLGLGCRLVLRGEPGGPVTGNELLDRILGARITWTRDRDPDEVLAEVVAASTAAGERPYTIAYGGAQALGAAAYAEAFREIVDAGERFDRIFVAASSGATQAGLVAGACLEGRPTRIVGVAVDGCAEALGRGVARLAGEVGRLHGVGPLPLCVDDVEIDGGLAEPGYGVVTAAEREAIELFARTEGLLLDPVYTARAAAGLLAQCRRRTIAAGERVLFLHTGGLPALFALGDAVQAAGSAS